MLTTPQRKQARLGLPSGGAFPVVSSGYRARFLSYRDDKTSSPLFLLGDAVTVLKDLPDEMIDLCMTSPPYWGQRAYHSGGIGAEEDYQDFIVRLCEVFSEVKRILKPMGSFWLNIGDTY